MPIFNYVCRQCKAEFEGLVRRDSDAVECSACGGAPSRMAVSRFNCTGMQLTKRLTLNSGETLRKGPEIMKGRRIRKSRIKIL